ncbi:ROK family transcriptional regulator [Glutamicibacter sp. PS]|uniref:ROK family transcriptional regulator n=1 Tax=Glutamicibacter sp. PS TaxID=3075634 RepID=UPI00284251CE|nr:ROK family transcriptional regulator [Glutamicibacter sp. PS]MDR4534589.1 ROK family transcriptional regulator [Glutamicibacter sp. PS]
MDFLKDLDPAAWPGWLPLNEADGATSSGAGLSPRTVNARSVLQAIWPGKPMTASELIEATGLTRATVLSVCRDLVEAGWIEQAEDSRIAGSYVKGRPALRYLFRPQAGYVIACESDESRLRARVADLHGVIVAQRDREIPADASGPTRRAALVDLVDSVLAEADLGQEQIMSMAIAVPAPVDAHGTSVSDGAEGWWERMNPNLQAEFAERGWRVLVDNDANLAALAEAAGGAGAGVRSFATLLSGERFGTGLVVDGRLLRGQHGAVGEMRVLEMIAGVRTPDGLAYHARTEVRAAAAAGTLRGELAEVPAESIDADLVFAAARRGDRCAQDILGSLAEVLTPVCMLLSGLLDLDRIIIAGSVAERIEPVLARTRELMSRDYTLSWAELVASKMGEDVVVQGALAAALAMVRDTALIPD